jgi:hypothetical protein
MTEEIGEYDTRINKARSVRKPDPEKVTCRDCEYHDRCFPFLKWFFSHICSQGRKKAVREKPDPKEVKIGNIHASPKPPGDP